MSLHLVAPASELGLMQASEKDYLVLDYPQQQQTNIFNLSSLNGNASLQEHPPLLYSFLNMSFIDFLLIGDQLNYLALEHNGEQVFYSLDLKKQYVIGNAEGELKRLKFNELAEGETIEGGFNYEDILILHRGTKDDQKPLEILQVAWRQTDEVI